MPENISLEIWPQGIAGAKSGLAIISVSAFLFWILGLIAVKLIPKPAENQLWRWKNIAVSFVHALMSGVGSVLW